MRLPSELVNPAEFAHPPLVTEASMITSEERVALSLYASRIYDICDRDAVIVDAGTFIGASTVALAEGLTRSRLTAEEQAGRIWSYDLFRATPGMSRDFFAGAVAPGASFRHEFDARTRHVAETVQVFEGDIMYQMVPNPPISILFVDVLWNWASTNYVGRNYYSKLTPGKSILIHQDFVYPFYPWIIIQMGLLDEYLKPAFNVPYSSFVFDVVKPIPSEAIPDCKDVNLETARRCYEKAVAIAPLWGKGAIWLGYAFYCASRREFGKARDAFAQVERSHGNDPLVTQYFGSIKGYIDDAERTGAPAPLHGGA